VARPTRASAEAAADPRLRGRPPLQVAQAAGRGGGNSSNAGWKPPLRGMRPTLRPAGKGLHQPLVACRPGRASAAATARPPCRAPATRSGHGCSPGKERRARSRRGYVPRSRSPVSAVSSSRASVVARSRGRAWRRERDGDEPRDASCPHPLRPAVRQVRRHPVLETSPRVFNMPGLAITDQSSHQQVNGRRESSGAPLMSTGPAVDSFVQWTVDGRTIRHADVPKRGGIPASTRWSKIRKRPRASRSASATEGSGRWRPRKPRRAGVMARSIFAMGRRGTGTTPAVGVIGRNIDLIPKARRGQRRSRQPGRHSARNKAGQNHAGPR
jgi:hypothetical protein